MILKEKSSESMGVVEIAWVLSKVHGCCRKSMGVVENDLGLNRQWPIRILVRMKSINYPGYRQNNLST
jgi:hypothetical protein